MAEKKISTEEELAFLRAEVERLNAALKDAASAAEEQARTRAKYIMSDADEVPTGKKVKVQKCINPWEKDERRHEYVEEEQELYFYHVDMPPVGGVQIMLNGNPLYHGQTYELTLDDLRTVKEIVYRIRDHEANIHGTDENAYRPKTNAVFSGRTGGRIH